MAAKTDEAQSLKGMLRKPGKPVSIEEMNQAIVQLGTGRSAKHPDEMPEMAGRFVREMGQSETCPGCCAGRDR